MASAIDLEKVERDIRETYRRMQAETDAAGETDDVHGWQRRNLEVIIQVNMMVIRELELGSGGRVQDFIEGLSTVFVPGIFHMLNSMVPDEDPDALANRQQILVGLFQAIARFLDVAQSGQAREVAVEIPKREIYDA